MLKDYIETIAKKVESGKKVYLGPACMETVLIAKMLDKEYSVLPAGFCDNDARKHGRFLNSFPTVRIFSFDEVASDESSEFLIVSPHHSAEIIGNLVFERGISEKRIINFQPIERRKTCGLWAQNWISNDEAFHCCCFAEKAPIWDNNPLDPQASIESLNKIRYGLIDGCVPPPASCVDCYKNTNSYIYTSRKLNSFDFSFRGWCNYKCEYCSASQPDLKNYNDRFCLEQYLVELAKHDMVNDIFSVLFAVGEPTLNEKRFALYDYCRDRQYFLDVFSNCSVFEKALFDVAQTSPVIIRKSFDAGTPETYAKIKGVNCFPKMLENVRRYLEAPYLVLNPKYLFVPGINDNETDVKNFVQLCAELKVDFVTPVFSFLDDDFGDSSHAKKMFKLLVDDLAAHGIFTANVDTLYSEAYHKVYSEAFA